MDNKTSDNSMQIDVAVHASDAHQPSLQPLQAQWSPTSFVVSSVGLGTASPAQWMRSPAGPFDNSAATVDHFIPFLLPSSSENEPRSLGGSSINKPRPAVVSGLIQSSHSIEELERCLDRKSSTTRRLVEVYFARVHPYWPILHAPTFNIDDASHVLLSSMIMLSNWIEGGSDHGALAPLLFEALIITQLVQEVKFGCVFRGLVTNMLEYRS